ncbi:hypothetical protein IQ07DRAFT_254050 [Pyrenochaeta sp. DS3sAY3a]|nr:hypothetical protein IQ07DRAFT_254050 [Pyrenochaeta sp. DS3sAY3a]
MQSPALEQPRLRSRCPSRLQLVLPWRCVVQGASLTASHSAARGVRDGTLPVRDDAVWQLALPALSALLALLHHPLAKPFHEPAVDPDPAVMPFVSVCCSTEHRPVRQRLCRVRMNLSVPSFPILQAMLLQHAQHIFSPLSARPAVLSAQSDTTAIATLVKPHRRSATKRRPNGCRTSLLFPSTSIKSCIGPTFGHVSASPM